MGDIKSKNGCHFPWGRRSEIPARILSGAFEHLRRSGAVYTCLSCPVIGGRPFIVNLMERVCATVDAEIVVYPLFEEYKYSRTRTYRRYDISKMVRYVAILRPADSFSLRFEGLEPVLLFSSKLRVAITRLIAAATRGPRAS